MTGSVVRRTLFYGWLVMLIEGCGVPIDSPLRDNPNDPDSPVWTTQRPYIYDVSKTPDNKVQVKWVTQTKYAASFHVERRNMNSGSYVLVGSVPGSAATNVFVDSTNIPVGFEYGYRVGIVGSAGAVTYSYDYPIDIF